MAKRMFGKRTLAVLLALVMVCNLAGVGVFAAEAEAPALVQNLQDAYYKQDGSAGSADDWEIHLSKTAAPTAQDNIYNITLKVQTKDTFTQISGATHGAAVLVLDVSSSMAKDAGTCEKCGQAENHSDHRGNRRVCEYEGVTHLDLLKEAVKSFLDGYVKDAAVGDKRMVAIVKFATNADTVLSWIDVNNAANLAAVKTAVENMNSTSGTNIEAGLVLGRNLLKLDAIRDVPQENQSLILFSDGSPTAAVNDVNDTSVTQVVASGGFHYYGGSGNSSDDLDDILAAVKAKKKAVAYNTDAELLKAVFGAENVITSSASSLSLDLQGEAGKIITNATNASTVTDPMGTGVSMVTVSSNYNAVTQNWDLSKYTPVVSNGITTYTITYQVEIDPEAVAADPANPAYTVLTPANGETTLNYTYGEKATPVKADFNEPSIRGIRSFTVSYAYVGEVPEGAAEVPAAVTYKAGQSVQVAAAPTLASYTFSGWSKQDFVMPAEDAVITGSWTENAKYDYTLIYNANFGENETKTDIESVTGTYATHHSMAVDGNHFSRPNHTFVGWNTEADGTGVAYTAEQAIALTAEENTLTLYAQWQIDRRAYTVNYFVRINGEAYALFAGTLPAGAPIGETVDYGTVIDLAYLEALGLPASLTDGEYTYERNAFEGITVTAQGNVVNVYYTCIVEEIPEEDVPQGDLELPEEPPAQEVPPVVEIPEEDVPQGDIELPEEPPAQEAPPVVEIPEEDIPLSDLPKTGDPVMIFAALAGLSGTGLVILGRKKKESEEEA